MILMQYVCLNLNFNEPFVVQRWESGVGGTCRCFGMCDTYTWLNH